MLLINVFLFKCWLILSNFNPHFSAWVLDTIIKYIFTKNNIYKFCFIICKQFLFKTFLDKVNIFTVNKATKHVAGHIAGLSSISSEPEHVWFGFEQILALGMNTIHSPFTDFVFILLKPIRLRTLMCRLDMCVHEAKATV